MVRKIDIEAMRALKAIADLGGVTKAANYLSLSQSAVSHKIRRLEEALGSQLLRRQAVTPLLTPDGKRLVHYAERILSLHDEAIAALGRKPLEGNLRLGITEDAAGHGLANTLGRFSRHYPQVAVNTHVAQSLRLERQLDDGEIDVAVMQVFEQEVTANDILLGTDQLLWVQSADFDRQDDACLPFIAFDQMCAYRNWAYEQAEKLGLRIKTILECASISGICASVEAGLGIALLNQKYVSALMKPAQKTLPIPPRVAYIVRSRHHQDVAKLAVDALTSAIAEEFRPVGIQVVEEAQ